MGRLRELRHLAGLSLIDAAPVIRVSVTSLYHAEREFRPLSDERIERLEQFYFQKIAERLARIGKLLSN